MEQFCVSQSMSYNLSKVITPRKNISRREAASSEIHKEKLL